MPSLSRRLHRSSLIRFRAPLLISQLGSTDKKLESIPKLFHDIHHEPEQAEATKLIAEWILSHVPKETAQEESKADKGTAEGVTTEKQATKEEVGEVAKQESESSLSPVVANRGGELAALIPSQSNAAWQISSSSGFWGRVPLARQG